MTPGTQSEAEVHNGYTTAQSVPTRREEGTGSLYKRGTIWWVKFYQDGQPVRESTGSDDRTYAEDYLRIRLSDAGITQELIRQRLDQSILKLRELSESTRCTIGAISELLVSADLMNRGYSVYRAFSHNSPCDLIAIKGALTRRIEVKTIAYLSRRPTVDRSQFDHLALVIRRSSEIKYEPELPPEAVTVASP